MFTGIVEKMGEVLSLKKGKLRIETGYKDLVPGESVAINGVCLTVEDPSGEFFAVPETLARTNLGALKRGDRVHLERALRAGDRFGGHFVQGHVDGTGTVRKTGSELHVEVGTELSSQMVPKGSVAIDGVSLTLVDVERDVFTIALVPFTRKHTTLGRRKKGSRVNIELDILGKYVRKASRITPEFLRKAGFA